jgi:hypothetical protein
MPVTWIWPLSETENARSHHSAKDATASLEKAGPVSEASQLATDSSTDQGLRTTIPFFSFFFFGDLLDIVCMFE